MIIQGKTGTQMELCNSKQQHGDAAAYSFTFNNQDFKFFC